MRNLLFIVALANLVSLASAAPPPPVKQAKVAPGRPADEPAWHDRFALPWQFTLADMKFASDDVKAAMLRADTAARQTSAKWPHRAGEAYKYLHWNSGSSGYCRTYQGKWESAGAQQMISIQTTVYDKSPTVNGFHLLAMSELRSGWRASLGYMTRGEQKHGFNLAFFHPTHVPKGTASEPQAGLQLSPGAASFSARRRDGNYNVVFEVTSRGRNFYSMDAAEIERYWKSPESFRAVALEELDRLAEEAKIQIPSGAAAQAETLGGPTGASPPRKVSVNESTVSNAVRDAVLDEALAEVGKRKKLVEDHFRDLHEAATSAFPKLMHVVVEER